MRTTTGAIPTLLILTAALWAGAPPAPVSAQTAEDRIYGQVVTVDGERLEGYIRWDKNEGSWGDILNGDKRVPVRNREQAEELGVHRSDPVRDRSIEFLGIRISWDEDPDDYPTQAQSGIRFGHVQRLVVLDGNSALLELKDGSEVELGGGSTDIGNALRGLTVDHPDRGQVTLDWSDVDAVEFGSAPEGLGLPRAERLHGTLTDRFGNRYTGYVAWDVDEILTSDVLDGEDGDREHAIPFRDVAAIERRGSDGARVTLTNGDVLYLEDSNDVDDSNRGTQVADPDLGQVLVQWDEFDEIRFHPPERSMRYADFDGGAPLRGVVVTEGGREIEGTIRWDNDEEYSWEILDGEFRDVVYDIEFRNVARVVRVSGDRAEVHLRDGRSFELTDSNDVDDGNKGIFVDTGDGMVAVAWDEVEEVRFDG